MKTRTLSELNFVVAPEAKAVIFSLAEKQHWSDPQVLKAAGMIDRPVIEGKWRYEPLVNYSTLPSGARKRIEQILKSTPVQGFIIGHEIEVEPERPKVEPLPWVVAPEPGGLREVEAEPYPKVKPLPWVVAPDPEPFRFPQPRQPQRKIDWEEVGRVAWDVTKFLGLVALGTLALLGLVASLFTSCMTDPAIIVVTPEGEWIEIYHYYD
jgi:hypothetical protein